MFICFRRFASRWAAASQNDHRHHRPATRMRRNQLHRRGHSCFAHRRPLLPSMSSTRCIIAVRAPAPALFVQAPRSFRSSHSTPTSPPLMPAVHVPILFRPRPSLRAQDPQIAGLFSSVLTHCFSVCSLCFVVLGLRSVRCCVRLYSAAQQGRVQNVRC